jgi:hypothetical protein
MHDLAEQRYAIVPFSRHLCRTHPQGREAGRSAGAESDKVRASDQPEDSEGLDMPQTLLARADEVIGRNV